MDKEFTGYYDSFGVPIYEGSKIEYFHWCYAISGTYDISFREDISVDPKSFIDEAIKNGYTQKHELCSKYLTGEEIRIIEMYKPCFGIVKWNHEYVTYEPLMDFSHDYTMNSFIVMINDNKNDGAYCKVID